MRKENVKKCKKLFTKNECNNIIRKKYNPLRAKKIEREGLFMKEKDVGLLEELNWKEKILVKIFTRTFMKVYKVGITFGFNNKWLNTKNNAINNAVGLVFK